MVTVLMKIIMVILPGQSVCTTNTWMPCQGLWRIAVYLKRRRPKESLRSRNDEASYATRHTPQAKPYTFIDNLFIAFAPCSCVSRSDDELYLSRALRASTARVRALHTSGHLREENARDSGGGGLQGGLGMGNSHRQLSNSSRGGDSTSAAGSGQRDADLDHLCAPGSASIDWHKILLPALPVNEPFLLRESLGASTSSPSRVSSSLTLNATTSLTREVPSNPYSIYGPVSHKMASKIIWFRCE